MRGCVLRLILLLAGSFVWVLLHAIWYILQLYVYALMVAVIGIRPVVQRITENVVWKAATQWALDFRLQYLLRRVVPPLAYICIIACWIFTASFTYFLLKWLVWR